jgi:hypothetical protein
MDIFSIFFWGGGCTVSFFWGVQMNLFDWPIQEKNKNKTLGTPQNRSIELLPLGQHVYIIQVQLWEIL